MADVSPTPAELVNLDDDAHGPRLNETATKFIADCIAEKERLGDDFPLASLLFDEAIDRINATGRIPGRELNADVFKQKPIKLTQKVYVPTKEFPKFNFNGKILGPKGSSLRALQKETMCKIYIKGRHSTRDFAKEDELRQSGDPRHAHLNKNLYVEISTVAAPAEAYARLAFALAEIRKYLIPDSNDEVSQNQRKEILSDPELAKRTPKSFQSRSSNNGGKADNGGGFSILKKITGRSFDDDEQPEYEDNAPTRNASQQRQPMNRSVQSSSFQGSNNEELSDRKNFGRPGNRNNARDFDNEGEEDEDRDYNRNAYSEMRQNMSQRQPMKRSVQEPSSYYQGRTPEKRSREQY